jgi:predicted DNA-binding protein with PD1-like motif
MKVQNLFSSAEGTTGKVIAARIHPNLDVLETIEKICVMHNIQYGQISTSIGSLRKVTLTYVSRIEPTPEEGYTTLTTMNGPFSLLVGQGLVSPAEDSNKRNIHYHAVVSGENNVVYGGDIKPGSITLTTLDLFITELNGIGISRSRDPETGAVVTTFKQA